MARAAAGKKATKASTSTTTNTTSKASSTSLVPEPFTYPSTSIRPFLSTLPTDHVYLVHVDNTPIELKRRVFVVPIFLNIFLIMILCVRTYYATPAYLDQIITIFGYETSYRVDTANTGMGDIMGIISNRTALLMADYIIFFLLGSWPYQFMFGGKANRYTGPRAWRQELGFLDEEIIVRKGRKWDKSLVGDRARGEWGLDEELTLKFKVEPALNKTTTAKTGYLLLDRDWDLDFKAMLDAHRLVKDGMDRDALEDIALAYHQKQWIMWKVHSKPTPQTDSQDDEKLKVFRDKLNSLCEDDEVFLRWIEIVQFETNLPAGFTEGRQAEALKELRTMLTERGVDFAGFMDDIGGKQGLPGLG